MNFFRLSRRADQDLGEIHAYISSANPTAALTFTQRMFDVFQLLAKNPLMGQDRSDLRSNLRSFSRGNYVVFFYPLDGGIEVAAVIHGARDVVAALREMLGPQQP